MSDSPRYDGQDDSVLPDRLQKILGLLPVRTAQRLRDWLTSYSVEEIEEQLDYILGDDTAMAAPILRPPINPGQVVNPEDLPDPVNPWDAADEAVKRIADMYKILSEAGMSEQTAVAIIADEVNGIRMADQTVTGFAKVPVAGMRAAVVRRSPIPGVEDYHPSAGWPPTPIE
jgi:hypothetical protein